MFSSEIAACDASSFSTAIRAGAKTPRGQVVLEIEHADQLGLVDQGQAENGASLTLTDVRILGKRGLGRGVVQYDALPGAHDIVEHRFRQRICGHATRSRRCTITVSPLVAASAAIRSSAPRARTNRPRSAPACSIAMRMSVSISFSRTISPETACDTLITVARSSCSTGAPIVLVGRGRTALPSLEVRIHLVELPHLAVGAPTEVAVRGRRADRRGDLLEAARRVEARGKLVGERLVVDEAVRAGRADGLFVEALGVELAALDAGDLRADQRGAVSQNSPGSSRPTPGAGGGGRPAPLGIAALSASDAASQSAASASAA